MEILSQCCRKQQKYADAESILQSMHALEGLSNVQKLATMHRLAEVFFESRQLDKAESTCNVAIKGYQASGTDQSSFFLSVALMIAILDSQKSQGKRSMADAYRLILPSGFASPYQGLVSLTGSNSTHNASMPTSKGELIDHTSMFVFENKRQSIISSNSNPSTSSLSVASDVHTVVESVSSRETASGNDALLMPKSPSHKPPPSPTNNRQLVPPKHSGHVEPKGSSATSENHATLRSPAMSRNFSSGSYGKVLGTLSCAWFSTLKELYDMQDQFLLQNLSALPSSWKADLIAKESTVRSIMKDIQSCMSSYSQSPRDAELLSWPSLVSQLPTNSIHGHVFAVPSHEYFLKYLLSKRDNIPQYLEVVVKIESHAREISFRPNINVLLLYLSNFNIHSYTYKMATQLVKLGADTSRMIGAFIMRTPPYDTVYPIYEIDALEYFLDSLAEKNFDFNAATVSDLSAPRHYYTPLRWAVYCKNSTLVHLLLRTAGVNPSAGSTGGYTALHEACRLGEVAIAKLLLSYGANPRAITSDGKTPRDLASIWTRTKLGSALKK